MAFSYKRQEVHAGNKRIVFGTYNAASVTSGDIVTGLSVVEAFTISPKGSSVSANQSVYNEDLPLANAGGTVSIVTTSGEVGSFIAIGI